MTKKSPRFARFVSFGSLLIAGGGALSLLACEVALLPTDPGLPPPLADSGAADAPAPQPGGDAATEPDAASAADAALDSAQSGPLDAAPPVRPPITGTSAMAVLAASMAPGTWAQLPVANQNAMLGVGFVSGTMIHYCNSMPWNPFNQSIEIMAMDHNYGRERYVRYSDNADQFQLMADDVGFGARTQHGYDHVTVNPANGDLFFRLVTVFEGAVSFKKKSVNAAGFVDGPSIPAMDQVAIGTAWWSGPFVGAGAQGGLVVFNSGNSVTSANDGHIAFYDPLADSWIFDKTAMAPFYGEGATYHSVIEYSPQKNVAVYGGGNVAPNKIWRLNADGTFIKLTDVPAGKALGAQNGLLVNDPVTGNFLLLSGGELWELDPTGAGTWTKQTGSRVPPANVGVPGPQSYGPVQGMILTAIPEYGVIAVIRQTSQNGGTFYLYRHA